MAEYLPLQRHRFIRTSDPDEAAQLLGSDFPVRALSKPADGRTWSFAFNSVLLGRTRLSAVASAEQEMGGGENTLLSVIFPSRGLLRQRSGARHEWQCSGRQAGGIAPQFERATRVTEGTRFSLVWAEQSEVARALHLLESNIGIEAAIQRLHSRPDVSGIQRLRMTVASIMGQIDSAPDQLLDAASYRAALDETLVLSLASFIIDADGGAPARVNPSKPVVRRCVDYIEANLTSPIYMEKLAKAAGASVRSVQVAFQADFGMTPTQYITRRRLEAARKHLILFPDDSIASAAFACGFGHLGEFAKAYAEHFGETPAQTRGSAPA